MVLAIAANGLFSFEHLWLTCQGKGFGVAIMARLSDVNIGSRARARRARQMPATSREQAQAGPCAFHQRGLVWNDIMLQAIALSGSGHPLRRVRWQ